MNQMQSVSLFISIINQTINRLNSPVKRHRVVGQIRKKKGRSNYILPPRDSLQTEVHTETQSEGMGKHIPCKWKPKESGDNYT